MAEYTPSETEVRDDYVAGEYAPERKAEFDRFLARVRRDAAREALDGLAAEQERLRSSAAHDDDAEQVFIAMDTRDRALQYRENFYRDNFDTEELAP